jgi:nucleotide-binding universal stress UspA family protein
MDNSPVMAGTDGSEASMRAAEWAAREAVAHDRALYVVSVPALPRLWQPGPPDVVADVICAAADQALGAAAARAAELEPGLCVCTDRLSGLPAQALAEAAAGASMLVVGSRGAGGFAALLLGSASRHVAFAAPCPVVVAREETAAVYRQIVVGVHDADRPAALGFAFEEARLHRARLQVALAAEVPGRRGHRRRRECIGGPGAGRRICSCRPCRPRQAQPAGLSRPDYRNGDPCRPEPRALPGRDRPGLTAGFCIRTLTGTTTGSALASRLRP